jgi:hypothetical protein
MAKTKEAGAPNPQTEPSALEVITQEPPGGTQYFHTDYVLLHWSLFDVKVRFGELVKHDIATKTSTVCDRAVVTMSWGEAKFLTSLLQQAISRYEQANGEIKTIPDLKLP